MRYVDRCRSSLMAVACCLGLGGPPTGTALESVTVVSENDRYAGGQDRHYTNGLQIDFGLNRERLPGWLLGMAHLLPDARTAADTRYHLRIGQNTYTPERYFRAALQTDDRPFAGWLYAEVEALRTHARGEAAFAVNLGVIGPASLAGASQRLLHDLTDSPQPRGWPHQLRNEPALLVTWRHSWFVPLADAGMLSADLVPRAGVALGNVATELNGGIALRIGRGLPATDAPQLFRSTVLSSTHLRPGASDGFAWHLFLSGQGHWIGRNVFLDGNTVRASHAVRRHDLVWNAAFGAVWQFTAAGYPVAACIAHVWRGREFRHQPHVNRYGSAAISVGF